MMKIVLTSSIVKFGFISLLVVLFCYLTSIIIGKTFIGIDDANIYFIYMKNIANGYGFVYQKNGENVEGFTSLLWTLIGSLLFFFTERIHIPLLILNVFILFYLIGQYRYLLDKISKNSNLYLFSFTLILILTPGFLSWNIFSLLETCLWTGLINLIAIDILKTIYLEKKDCTVFIILSVLLIFARPEALLLSFYFLVCKVYFLYKNTKNVNIVRTFIALFSPIALATVLLYVWRYYNFGVLFPNTYYAKVSGSVWEKIDRGFYYNILFFKENPLFTGILLFSICYFIINLFFKKFSFSKIQGQAFLFSTVLFSILIPFLVGGDHFGLYRFMQPYIPIYIILFILMLDSFKIKTNHKIFILIFAFILQTFSSYNIFKILYTSDKTFPSRIEWDIVKSNRYRAKQLNSFFVSENLPSIGVLAAGAYAYYYDGRSIDLLGLNNVRMAHAPKNPKGPKNHASFNKEIFYTQQPDIIMANAVLVSCDNPASKDFIKFGSWESQLLGNIQSDAKFRKMYANCIILNKEKSLVFKGYIKRSYINSALRTDPNYYIKEK